MQSKKGDKLRPTRFVPREQFSGMKDSAQPKRIYRFGLFQLDCEAEALVRDGLPVKLHGQPMQVLRQLLQHPGEIVAREELRQALWPDGTYVEFDVSLNAALKRLRSALGDDAENPVFIETVPKRGYRFIAPVQCAQLPQASAGPEKRAPFGPLPSVIRSLAVLPFENLSGDPAQEYFADGITDEIITRVAHIRGLRVISRTSSMQYKRTRKTAPQIGRELEVDALLEGSLERSGQRVRMRAQLIHASTDCHCWAQSYDRELTDILSVESSLAQSVAAQIHARVAPEPAAPPPQRTVNVMAFEHYLKGNYFLSRRGGDSMNRAVEQFRRAVELDAAFAPAHGGLANACYSLAYSSGRYKDYMPQVRSAAERALRLDATLSQAHTAMALAASCDYNLLEAQREHQLAISFGPNDANAHQTYAVYLVTLGRFEEANAEIALARALDPVSRIIATTWGTMLYLEGRDDDACRELNDVIEMAPEFSEAYLWRAAVLLHQGRHNEALEDLEQLERLAQTPRTLALIGYGLGVAGRKSQALDVLAALKNLPDYISAWWLASVHLGLGENEQAIAWLEKACEEQCMELIALNVHPAYDPLRKDPRFCRMVARVGLPVWRPQPLSAAVGA
jgi:TolB-like protein/Flp pilus assembly protein TadD